MLITRKYFAAVPVATRKILIISNRPTIVPRVTSLGVALIYVPRVAVGKAFNTSVEVCTLQYYEGFLISFLAVHYSAV